MATQIQWTKTGLKLACDVSKRPAPRPKQIYPVPSIPVAQANLLELSLEPIAESGRKGIRVVSHGDLPGGPSAKWTLRHACYQGTTAPSPLPWKESPIPGQQLNILIEAMSSATHVFALKRVEAGQTAIFPEATICTPADDTLKNLDAAMSGATNAMDMITKISSDGWLSRSEKPGLRQRVNTLEAESAAVKEHAAKFGVPVVAFDKAITDLKVHLDGLVPPWTDLSKDTPLDRVKFDAVWTEYYKQKQVLINAISAKAAQDVADKAAAVAASVSDWHTLLGRNILAFGAVGDGEHDDTAAIQRAIDAAGRDGGGVVLFPPAKKYYLVGKNGSPGQPGENESQLCLKLCDNLTLLGTGRRSEIRLAPQKRAAGKNAHIIFAERKKNISLSGIHLNGDYLNQPDLGTFRNYTCGQIWDCSNIRVENCEIEGGTAETFYVLGAHPSVGKTNLLFCNNLVHDTGEWGFDCLGIHMDRIDGGTVTGNIFQRVGLRGIGVGRCNFVNISGNYIGRNYDGGVRIVGSTRVNVTGNTMEDCNKYGIDISPEGIYDCEDILVTGNFIYGNATNGQSLVFVLNARRVVVNSNSLRTAKWDKHGTPRIGGVVVTAKNGGVCSDISIQGNSLHDIDPGYKEGLPAAPTAILVLGESEEKKIARLVVSGNVIHDAYAGIRIDNAKAVICSQNLAPGEVVKNNVEMAE